MSKVRASSYEYSDVEKSRIFREQNFKGEEHNKQLDREDSSVKYLISKLHSCVVK